MDKDKYKELIHRFYKEQYGDDEADNPIVTDYENINDYMKSKIEKRKHIPQLHNPNLTDVPTSQLKSLIERAMIIKVGEFTVSLNRENITDGYTSYKATIQEASYTITGFGHRMKKTKNVTINKDIRFEGFNNKKYFLSIGEKLTLDEVIDLVKWLRAVTKLAAFI